MAKKLKISKRKNRRSKTKKSLVKGNNPISQNPLMRKGGSHKKSKSSVRGGAKKSWRKEFNFI